MLDLAGAGHPCAALPAGAVQVFDALMRGQQPQSPCPWVAVLKRQNLLRPAEPGGPNGNHGWEPQPWARQQWHAWVRKQAHHA